jgi:hypothetical protein
MNLFKIAITIVVLTVFFSCNRGPKVIHASEESKVNESTGVFSGNTKTNKQNIPVNANDLHKVTVKEILKTSKYIYLNVTEKNEKFWIATRLQDIKVGETYFYKGGLLKTNFESKEYKRVFKKIYLVSNIVSAKHSSNNLQNNSTELIKKNAIKPEYTLKSSEKITVKGSLKIAELVANPKKFEGKTIQLSGKCVKINPNIMGKNWIHLQDGSKNDYDLVITSDTFVKEGTVLTLKGKVTLAKDFGAGYKYDLIVEDAVIIK